MGFYLIFGGCKIVHLAKNSQANKGGAARTESMQTKKAGPAISSNIRAMGRNPVRCSRLEVQVRWWLVLAALFWACSGCAMVKKNPQKTGQSWNTRKVAGAKATTDSNEDLPFFHQVRWEGETLSLIAKWYTGDWKNWKALADVNPWVEPNTMFTGLKVKIPRQLLKNQKQMPREFVLSSSSQNKAGSQTNKVNKNEPSGSSAEEGTAKGSYMQFVGP
jgi:hypothetical protein